MSTGEHRLTLAEVVSDLVADGILSPSDRQKLLHADSQADTRRDHPLEVVANAKIAHRREPERLLTLEYLTAWLAQHCGLDYLRVDPLRIDVPSIGNLVTSAYAASNHILPVAVTGQTVVFATAEPYITVWIDELGKVLRRDIVRVIANPRDITRYRDEFFGVSRSVRSAVADTEDRDFSLHNQEALVELGKASNLDANDRHIVHIVDWLLKYALEQRASDIHMEPRRNVGNIRFRIDGQLHPVYQVPATVMVALTSRVKILGRMDLAEKRRPQDGRIKTRAEDGREVEIRLSTMPTAFGEKLVLRIFDPQILMQDASALGFDDAEAHRWQQMVTQPNGIVLVTGPTGSGKTTTLYSTLRHLATPAVNICTVEDPIEMVESNFNQMQVHHAIGLDFASGIRTMLRQDPDIIMVGEIRDLETAEMAIQAALTGHLVLSSLHTNDAPAAITRLLDIGVPHYLVKATLLGIVAQRLVRTLCPRCKQTESVDPALWESLVTPWRLTAPAQIYCPEGCLECRRTGYLGRTGLYEILVPTPALRHLVNANYDEAQLRRHAYQAGLRPLRISGALKIAQGRTSIEEVFKVAPIRPD